MEIGMLAFLGAFGGFYLGLAAYLFLRALLQFSNWGKSKPEENEPGPIDPAENP